MPDQRALGFMLSQTALIQKEIYYLQYPDVDFRRLVPVSTEGTGWESEIQHFSADILGEMKEINAQTTVFPLVNIEHSEHQVRIADYGVAMKYGLKEIKQALMVPGRNLKREQMRGMRRAHDQTHWELILKGRTDLGWDGLINNSNVTSTTASADGAGNSTKWDDKTAEQIILDINKAIEGVYTESNTVLLSDTVALPPGVLAALSSKFISGTSVSVARWIMENSVYTTMTGRKLNMIEIRGLENAAASNEGRMVVYKRDPMVLTYHLVMPLMIFEPQQHLLSWTIPAMSRSGGLEIKLPKAIRYVDGIST